MPPDPIPVPPSTSPQSSDLPRNLPTVNFGAFEIGEGWKKVGIGAVVKTWYQSYSFYPRCEWKLTAFFTSEGFKNGGVSNYRKPASVGAWMTVLRQLPAKYCRLWVDNVKHWFSWVD